jgi:uncharacterized protein YuzE
MATQIKTDGTTTEVEPKNGRDFKLDELYQLIECETLDMIRLADGRFMWMDEKRKINGKEINQTATKLAPPFEGGVEGTVLICDPKQVK